MLCKGAHQRFYVAMLVGGRQGDAQAGCPFGNGRRPDCADVEAGRYECTRDLDGTQVVADQQWLDRCRAGSQRQARGLRAGTEMRDARGQCGWQCVRLAQHCQRLECGSGTHRGQGRVVHIGACALDQEFDQSRAAEDDSADRCERLARVIMTT